MKDSFDSRLARHAQLGPFFLRVGLGVVFLAHAYLKLRVYTLAGTAAFFAAHGFPGWTAYPVFLAELLGGLALLAGVRTREVSLVLALVMVGALKPHAANGWIFTNPGGGWEYVAFLIVALVAQTLLGPGAARAGAFAAGRGRVEARDVQRRSTAA